MKYVFDFVEYYCFCGRFLFNSGDIVSETSFFHRRFFWVMPERVERQLFFGRVLFRSTNLLICSDCRHVVGAITYPFDREREILRFNNSYVYSKIIFVVKDNEIFKCVEKTS